MSASKLSQQAGLGSGADGHVPCSALRRGSVSGYKSIVRSGGRYAPFHKRDIGRFRARHTSGKYPVPDEQGRPPKPSILEKIDATEPSPIILLYKRNRPKQHLDRLISTAGRRPLTPPTARAYEREGHSQRAGALTTGRWRSNAFHPSTIRGAMASRARRDFRSCPRADIRLQRNICRDGPMLLKK